VVRWHLSKGQAVEERSEDSASPPIPTSSFLLCRPPRRSPRQPSWLDARRPCIASTCGVGRRTRNLPPLAWRRPFHCFPWHPERAHSLYRSLSLGTTHTWSARRPHCRRDCNNRHKRRCGSALSAAVRVRVSIHLRVLFSSGREPSSYLSPTVVKA
jgi:hypothetical protein